MAMCKKGAILLFFVALFVIQSASAVEHYTDLLIKVESYQNLVIRIQHPLTEEVIESKYATSGYEGIARTNFTTTYSEVDLTIMLVGNGEIIKKREFSDIKTGGLVELDIRDIKDDNSDSSTASVNFTINSTENSTDFKEETAPREQVENPKSQATGRAILNDFSSSVGGYLGYAIIAFLIIGVIIFIVSRRKYSTGPPHLSTKLIDPPLKKEKPLREELQEAESKLRLAEEEIERIKQKEKLIEAEQRYEAAKKELESLRRINQGSEQKINDSNKP